MAYLRIGLLAYCPIGILDAEEDEDGLAWEASPAGAAVLPRGALIEEQEDCDHLALVMDLEGCHSTALGLTLSRRCIIVLALSCSAIPAAIYTYGAVLQGTKEPYRIRSGLG